MLFNDKVNTEKAFLSCVFEKELDHLNDKVLIVRVDSSLDLIMEKEFRRKITITKK